MSRPAAARTSVGGSSSASSSTAAPVLTLPPVSISGETWERFPIYAAPLSAPPFHLIKFLTALPVANPSAVTKPATGAAVVSLGEGEAIGILPPPSAASLQQAMAASQSSSASAAGGAVAPPKLAYPFSKETKLYSPRYTEYRSKIQQRKKVQKGMTGAGAAAGTGAADGTTGATTAASSDDSKIATDPDGGINPLDRKWRIEDPRAKPGAPTYLGTKEIVSRRDALNSALNSANHFWLLQRDVHGRFSFVNTESYLFRHVDHPSRPGGANTILSLEEAEQKMKQRYKRFEKKIKIIDKALGSEEAEEGGGGGSTGGTAGGAGGSSRGGVAMEGARPSIAGRIQPAERVEKADNPFEEMGVVSSKAASGMGASVASLSAGARKAAALARSAKIKREGGADYTRTFDDDDVDFGGEDNLDGQGDEAPEDDQRDDDAEALLAAQAEVEQSNAAQARTNRLLAARKTGMSFEDAEELLRDDEEAEERAEDEAIDQADAAAVAASGDEEKSSGHRSKSAAAAAAAAANGIDNDDESDDDFEEEDLTLDDDDEEEDEEEEEDEAAAQDVSMMPAATLAPPPPQVAIPAAAAANKGKKRPVSPATSSGAAPATAGGSGSGGGADANKKARVDAAGRGVAVAAAPAGAAPGAPAAAPAAAAAALSPFELSELERVTIFEMLRAPAETPFTSKSIALLLKTSYPKIVNKRTINALRDVLKKVASIAPDKTHIILKTAYQKGATTAAAGAPPASQ